MTPYYRPCLACPVPYVHFENGVFELVLLMEFQRDGTMLTYFETVPKTNSVVQSSYLETRVWPSCGVKMARQDVRLSLQKSVRDLPDSFS